MDPEGSPPPPPDVTAAEAPAVEPVVVVEPVVEAVAAPEPAPPPAPPVPAEPVNPAKEWATAIVLMVLIAAIAFKFVLYLRNTAN